MQVFDLFPETAESEKPPRAVLYPLASDIFVGTIASMIAVAMRTGLEQFIGGVAPFILTFPAVMAATLLRGRHAGAIATLFCQALTIAFVFPNWVSMHGGRSTDIANIVLSTIALAATVWATASYRDVAALLRSRCQHQVRTLSLLMTEADHRTKNNYQIAAGLLAHQSTTMRDPKLSRELGIASSRLEVIASAYDGLPTDIMKHEKVDLAGHVGRIVSTLQVAATPDNVQLRFRGDHVLVPIETAIISGLIVNEWVTNALKYAFDDGPGGIFVDVAASGDLIEVVVDDDGELSIPVRIGRGNDLMKSFADVIRGSICIVRDNGTRCSLKFSQAL